MPRYFPGALLYFDEVLFLLQRPMNACIAIDLT
jgi:hypothetical protein